MDLVQQNNVITSIFIQRHRTTMIMDINTIQCHICVPKASLYTVISPRKNTKARNMKLVIHVFTIGINRKRERASICESAPTSYEKSIVWINENEN